MIFKIIGLALIIIFVFFTFNILTKYNKSYNYRNEDREKELEAKHYKLREIIKDEEEIKLVDDLIASKVKSEAKSKMFCETSIVYDIYDKCLTEEILKRKKQ